MVNYSYLSDGTKLSALDGNGEGLVYSGPFVYRKGAGNGNNSLTLESAAFGGGRLTPTGAMLYVHRLLLIRGLKNLLLLEMLFIKAK